MKTLTIKKLLFVIACTVLSWQTYAQNTIQSIDALANSVNETSMDAGKMEAKLLEGIEELAPNLIEQSRQNDALTPGDKALREKVAIMASRKARK